MGIPPNLAVSRRNLTMLSELMENNSTTKTLGVNFLRTEMLDKILKHLFTGAWSKNILIELPFITLEFDTMNPLKQNSISKHWVIATLQNVNITPNLMGNFYAVSIGHCIDNVLIWLFVYGLLIDYFCWVYIMHQFLFIHNK